MTVLRASKKDLELGGHMASFQSSWVVMIACVVVFIAMQILGDQEVMLWLAWPFDPTLKFEFWRYFTHALMHFSLMHILFNLLWWT